MEKSSPKTTKNPKTAAPEPQRSRKIIDTETGLEVDKKTGLLIDPKTGLLIDPDRLMPKQEEPEEEKDEEKIPPAANALASVSIALAALSVILFIVVAGIINFSSPSAYSGWLVACLVLSVLSVISAVAAGGISKRFTEWRVLTAICIGAVTAFLSIGALTNLLNTPTQPTAAETSETEETANSGTGATSSGSVTKSTETNTPATITLGTFTIEKGTTLTTYYLPVTIRNTDSKAHSYTIEIEATKSNGTRIDTDTIQITNLAPNQSTEEKCFTDIDSSLESDFKQATFRVIKNQSTN